VKWKKLGKIFDPTKFDLPDGCAEFAQSPQALVFGDFVRIYFSTRSVDKANGKYLSHVAFVDMDEAMREVIAVSRHTVIELGKLGCFDEHGIFPMNVLRHGGRVLGYTCGWSRRVSVSVDTAIGLAISRDDGRTFQRIGDGPVLAASLREPCLVGDPFVGVFGNVHHMWYIFGTGWKKFSADAAPDRTYKIGHAVSNDGVNWVKEEGRRIIDDRLGADESQALPSVIRIGRTYHMFFCYRQSHDFRTNRSRSYRIGHAHSDDLADWTRNDDDPGLDVTEANGGSRVQNAQLSSNNRAVSGDACASQTCLGTPLTGLDVTEGDWDSDMLCYPHAFECRGKVYLLYNGNEFGRYGFGLAVLE